MLAWLETKSTEFRRIYAERVADFGVEQARPYSGMVYTDNYDMLFIGVEMLLKGIEIWREMCDKAKIWRSPEAIIIDTCVVWIGGRCVLNGGFGCLVPSKRQRAIEAIKAALNGTLSRDNYESNNSFLGYANDILQFPAGALQGITGPLRRPGFGSDLVELTPLARAKYSAMLELLLTRPCASFMAGVDDAGLEWSGTGSALRRVVSAASDCCTDPSPTPENAHPQPHVCGVADGLYWRFRLEGEWLHRHITLTESLGPALNTSMFARRFRNYILVLETDATAAVATAGWTTHAAQLQVLQDCLAATVGYAERADSLWVRHLKGWGNGLPDAGSRDDVPGMRQLAAAFGISLTEVQLGPDELAFLANVLEKTHEWRTELPQFTMPHVPAASLAKGASCNNLRDGPIGDDPSPAWARYESHTRTVTTGADPHVPAASLARGASCNSLGDGPAFAKPESE